MLFSCLLAKGRKAVATGKKGGPEGPGRLMWKEIGNRCWDPGKWSWDEAGRTKKREAHGPDPTHSSGTCSGPGWLSLSSKHSILQTWNPRREHAASELFHLPAIHTHTHTQPSPARRSLDSHRRSKQSTPTPSDPSVDPSSFFSLRIFWDDAGPLFRVIENHARPLHPPEENSAVCPDHLCPPTRPPRLRPWPRRRASSEPPRRTRFCPSIPPARPGPCVSSSSSCLLLSRVSTTRLRRGAPAPAPQTGHEPTARPLLLRLSSHEQQPKSLSRLRAARLQHHGGPAWRQPHAPAADGRVRPIICCSIPRRRSLRHVRQQRLQAQQDATDARVQ